MPDWSADETGAWWKFVKWGEHRNSIKDIEPFINRLYDGKGKWWLTTENIMALLDAKDLEKVTFKSPSAGDAPSTLTGRKRKTRSDKGVPRKADDGPPVQTVPEQT